MNGASQDAGGPPGPHHTHRAAAPRSLKVAVLTVSDSRTADTDLSGRLMAELAATAGHRVVAREILPDDPQRVAGWVHGHAGGETQMILINGGTGIAPRDRTYEAVDRLLERTLPGFGELFRNLSYQEIGAAAMASRALAGVRDTTLIFCTPGSPAAVRLAMERLILPEAPHLWGLLEAGPTGGA